MANILVVDDEMGIRDLLSETLGDEGHTVLLAENAAEARAARLKARPDLVLLDIWMPDTDGVSLLKEWSAGGLLNMPVLMMSGHATIDTAVEATRIGAMDFLEKPFPLAKLLASVKKALAAKPLQKAASETAVAVPVAVPMAAPLEARIAGLNLDLPLREARDAFERSYFEYHMAQEKGSMTRIAEKTGLERTHLYRKLKALGLPVGGKRGDSSETA
ncbi:MAG TPA: response regulator [Burkholderiales bacterium]|jgi:DNA-binding NtrC family response regulator|nr:response regulator [Burkholderiales bacterium]